MPEAEYEPAKKEWEATCRAAWDIRRHTKVEQVVKSRGQEWLDMLNYFARLFPDMSKNQLAKHGAARAAMIVNHALATLVKLNAKDMQKVLHAFRLHEADVDILAMDIGMALNTIEQDLHDKAYCLGFAAMLMKDMYEE